MVPSPPPSQLPELAPQPAQKSYRKLGTLGAASLTAFAAGFGDCLFDASKANICVTNAQGWITPFYNFGMGLIEWAIAIFKAAF